jgi:Arc/MetJ family transcription regulator
VATNLALDEMLIAEAVKVGRHRTKREAVTTALEEYIKMKRRLGLLDLVGRVDYHAAYDRKDARRRGNDRSRIEGVRGSGTKRQ